MNTAGPPEAQDIDFAHLFVAIGMRERSSDETMRCANVAKVAAPSAVHVIRGAKPVGIAAMADALLAWADTAGPPRSTVRAPDMVCGGAAAQRCRRHLPTVPSPLGIPGPRRRLLDAQCREAALCVDKILKGATPGQLPVPWPSRFELVVNLRTARTLGLTLPVSLTDRADEMAE